MEVRILGPFEIVHDGVSIPISGTVGPKALVVLLSTTGNTVSIDGFVDALWDEAPPATARRQVTNILASLRRMLDPLDPALLHRRSGAYRLGECDLDARRFDELVLKGRSERDSGNLAGAAELLDTALGLWRGQALIGLDGRYFANEAGRLEESRLRAIETRMGLGLGMGTYGRVLELAGEVLDAHPQRQSSIEPYMLSLHHSGRTNEALSVYLRLQERLREEMGIDPNDNLATLYRRMLRNEVPSPAPVQSEAPMPGPASVPAMLPAATSAFTGRAECLRALDELLLDEAAPHLAVINECGGIGKTTLALHWAHRVADRFPDGQLYVNLRGFGPEDAALEPSDAVRLLLYSLGIEPERIPAEPEARFGLYRSVLAGRKCLVVLDNARDAAQIRPLVPGSSESFTVATSRNQLQSITASHGAHHIRIGLFSSVEARELLTRLLGQSRIEAEPEATDRIIEACNGLPLAIAITAARAAAQRDFPLTVIADQLDESRNQLDAFSSDDPITDVRAVFSWSYHALGNEAARIFRLLGLHPGPDTTVPAVVALAADSSGRVTTLMRELTAAHLITEPEPGRFAFHDLLQVYAAELTATLESDRTRQDALRRLLDHYLHTAHGALNLTRPLREPLELIPAHDEAKPYELDDVQEAQSWFTAELRVLAANVRLAAQSGFDTHAWQLVWTISNAVYGTGNWQAGLDIMDLGIDAARRLDDVSGQVQLMCFRAQYLDRLARFDESLETLNAALALCAESEDRALLARVHRSFSSTYGEEHRYVKALGHTRAALRIYEEIGDERVQGPLLNNIGWYHALLENFDDALQYCHRSIPLSEAWDDFASVGAALDSIGYIHLRQDQPAKAVEFFQRAIDLHLRGDCRLDQAVSMEHLGDAYHTLGQLGAAQKAWKRQLEVLEDIDPRGTARVRAKLEALTNRGTDRELGPGPSR